MKKIVCFFLFFALISCNREVKQSDISKINGYWEIEKVILASGENKDYKISETIDYFELQKGKQANYFSGFRKKVMPQLDGKYLVNDIAEKIVITKEKSDFYINYSTDYLTWKEQIIEIQDSVLVLINNDKVEYHYKKAVPFSLK